MGLNGSLGFVSRWNSLADRFGHLLLQVGPKSAIAVPLPEAIGFRPGSGPVIACATSPTTDRLARPCTDFSIVVELSSDFVWNS